jgi:hypothetical protein
VLASDELITAMDPSLLPDGLRLAIPAAIQHDPRGPASWYRFEDDSAPAELDGKRVELILGRQGREGAKSVIIERRVIT